MLNVELESEKELFFKSKYHLRTLIAGIIFILIGLVFLYRKFQFDYYYSNNYPGFFAFNDPRPSFLIFSLIVIGGGLGIILIGYRFLKLRLSKESNLVQLEEFSLTSRRKETQIANSANEIILKFDNLTNTKYATVYSFVIEISFQNGKNIILQQWAKKYELDQLVKIIKKIALFLSIPYKFQLPEWKTKLPEEVVTLFETNK